ncbi:MAG: MFS transporter [Proteobacteria bacterium]|nr:MFS transporter [Pseudomonadota bacterium]
MSTPSTTRVVLAGAIGNVLEWFDFAVYGYFAAAIGRTFFPSADPVAQVLAAFGIFAVGFLLRPVGGALIGYLGDRFGRRKALTFSVLAMAIPTFLVGVLPGYATLGLAAPVLLTVLRMIQGLSVGGEYTTSIVFMVENAAPDRRGVVGAMACCGATAGILAGSATGALLASLMSETALETWGWRIPFLFGLVVGLAGFALRYGLVEEPLRKAAVSPLLSVYRHHRVLLLRLAGLATLNSVGFYLMFVYVVSWLQQVDGVTPSRALDINTISMVMLLPAMVAMGWLSDRIGRRPVMLLGVFATVLAAWPLFWLMHAPTPGLELAGQLGFVLTLGAYMGAQPAMMVEAVPAAVRCSAIALGYNVTMGIVGGLSPLAAAWLIERTGNDYSPAFMIMAAAIPALVAVLSFSESFRAPLLADEPARG